MTDNLLEEYERYQREVRRRRPRTLKSYLAELRPFLQWLARSPGELAIEAVARSDKASVLEFLRRPASRGAAPGPAQWNNRVAALRSLFDYLCRIEVLTVNPALKIDRQRVFEKQTMPLSLNELVRLVDSLHLNSSPALRARNVALAQVMIHCALRVAEVVSLDVKQIDLEHYYLLDVRTKGGKSLAAALNDVAAEALGSCLEDRGVLDKDGGRTALFLSERGSRLSVRAVQELVRQHGLLAGISQPVTPHLLRHSSATQLHELGVALRVVQEHCGHASVTTTQRYVHVAREERRSAVDKLSSAWKRQAGQNVANLGSENTASNPN
jgi:site-specific recombinase XerD